ncbi:MAG: acetyl-CoA carboxylase, carboxyltransferase subunit beta [Clostridia bacterium]|nr:acetyl-CoA carboxylase, carboxyltransferase subunit beta [Clostridia bacterium]
MPKKEKAEKAEKNAEKKEEIPEGHIKCPSCGNIMEKKALGQLRICPKCAKLFRMNAKDRIKAIADKDSFEEFDINMESKNPLNFPDYSAKVKSLQEKTGLKDAVKTGKCTIGGRPCVIAVMDSGFIMGSLGSVVGEKVTRAFEYATENKMAVIVFTCSGGARMQEGILSLMQMAKVSAAVAKHSEAGLLYITVLTDPTTGGVTASYAMLGDIILAEPKTLIGFAGRRVIEGTIKQKLPDEFQTSEFLLEHGFVDAIVEREKLPETLERILKLHNIKKVGEE